MIIGLPLLKTKQGNLMSLIDKTRLLVPNKERKKDSSYLGGNHCSNRNGKSKQIFVILLDQPVFITGKIKSIKMGQLD